MTHMTFCTASIDILILHSSHCAIPVVQQVFLTVIHCFFVRRTFPDSFYSLYKLFLLALIQGLPQPSFGFPCLIQHLVGRLVDIFHHVELIQYRNSLFNIFRPCFDPCSSISTDIHRIQIPALVVRVDVFLHPFKQMSVCFSSAAKTSQVEDILQFLPPVFLFLSFILYLLINNYLPMIGIFLAFKDYSYIKGPFKSNWCGFKNFEFLFRSDAAFTMIRNTLAYNVVFIITTTVLAITLAIMMNELNKLTISKFFQGSLLLPNLVSMVIVSYLVYAFLNPESGLLNNTLELLHLPTVNWYSEPKYWPMILVIVNAWKNAGYASIVYIGSIAGIDPSLYEAARIDGAGKWKQIVRVTLPQLKSTIILMTLLSVGRIFASDFGLFYQVPMDSGALYNVTQTVDTYVYRALIKNGDVGMSAAASLIQSIVGFVTVVTANWLVKKADSDSALF